MQNSKLWLFSLIIIASCTAGPEKEAMVTEKKPLQDDAVYELRESSLQFTVDFALNDLESMINGVIPTTLVNDKLSVNEKGDSITLVIQRRGKLKLSSRGNRLHSAIPLHVSALVNKKILGINVKNSKPIEFSIILEMVSDLKINKEWGLESTCLIKEIKWIKKPTIKILLTNVKLDKIIEKQLEKNHEKLEKMICDMLPKAVPIRNEVEKVWTLMCTPQLVAKKPVQLWLNSTPGHFSSAFDTKSYDTLKVIIFAKSKVAISPDSPHSFETPKLPTNNGKVNASNGLDVHAAFHVPLDVLDKFLNEKLGKQSFSYSGLSIHIKSIQSQVENGRLVIKIKVDGDATGVVTASGVPSLNRQLSLGITDFKYEIESKNVVINAADWATNSTFSEYVGNMVNLPLKPLLDSLDFKIAKAMNQSRSSDKIGLDIHFNQFKEDTLLFQKKQLIWLFDVKGRANFTLKSTLLE